MIHCAKGCNALTYAGHNMKYTWSADRNANTGSACEVSICSRSVRSSLFIAEADEPHPKIETLLANVGHWEPGKPKDDLDTQVMECLGDDFGSVCRHCNAAC